MPELPDVEVYKLLVEGSCLNRRIARAEVLDASMLAGIGRDELESALRGATISSVRRHGKHLFIGLGGSAWLELHFGMTGYLEFFPEAGGRTKHERLRLDFEDTSRLVYDCQRKLGEIGLIDDPETFIRQKGLGPDPYAGNLDRSRFAELVSSKRGSIKAALMDQSLLAGIGNVYSDEILLAAGLHPKAKAAELSQEDLTRLYEAMGRILSGAVERGADPGNMPGFLVAQRRPEGTCPRCGGSVQKLTVSGRSAYLCPRCQG